jgi:hypothetical protein
MTGDGKQGVEGNIEMGDNSEQEQKRGVQYSGRSNMPAASNGPGP